ncbi:MAG: hypothetical protein PSU93_11115 [Methylobacter sp.]|uniref:Uncharacterized protein n=1 Tax=Candidatus Methylobacter titanis TaxID=3053457 RepID=A0AA43Q6L1_9GAMM|nr:hypothetical protein [Candidatus Methylobacter titanis]
MIACASVLVAVIIAIALMLGLKALHDVIRQHRASLIEKYIEIAGRITALFVGTLSVEMIMQGSNMGRQILTS